MDTDWHEGAPRQGMNVNDFAVRWTGTIRPTTSGTYRLGVIGTLKAELAIDDSVVVRTVYAQRDGEFHSRRP